jgi:large subunit ribosomal protein L9
MQVLLIKDVDNLGYAGDVKKVAGGFGRNYLLPQGLAVLATAGALKQAETIRRAAEKHRAQEMEDAKAIASQLEGLVLLFERRAGETGKLYGSVTSGDIAEAIAEKTDIELDKRKVALAEPIRNLGKQEVPIKLMIDMTTTIEVEVLPLGGILERERLTEAEAAAAEAAAEAGESVTEAVEAVEVEAATEAEAEATAAAEETVVEAAEAAPEVEEVEETEEEQPAE